MVGFLTRETTDEDLWEWFRERFDGWDREAFESLEPELRRDLKAGLRQNGVFVGKGRLVLDQLVTVLTEEEQAI